MNPPGGEALIHRAVEIALARIEAMQGDTGLPPRRFADLHPEDQAIWMQAMRDVTDLTILTLLHNMAEAVSGYDGCQGAAYQRLVHRYALEELNLPLNRVETS